ncbi:MAG TPA: ABC transporter substrate-binding protein [Acetobacteraceae bacterium]|jgi:NitT/TauT family transport system substrate-binding protein|nr:ABC transporter substrate-binding protein [Acetobacteraceae bacterium]
MTSAVSLGRRSCLGLFAAGLVASHANAAQPLRLGLLHTLSPAPFYIAQQRGYFRDNGIDLTFRFFDAAQPIAAAAVAGDIDVGVTALTGGFYNLAEKGVLKVIGGAMHEEPGYEGSAILVSNKAFDAGLTTPAKLAGQSFAITQYGSSFHYMLGRIAEVEHFDMKSMALRPVQEVSNMLAAVETGQVDATIAIASQAKAAAAAGKAHIIAWVGDIVPYQITAVFTTPQEIKRHADLLDAFAKAYQRGVADYRAAFLRKDASGKPIHDAETDAAIVMIQKYVFTGDPHAREKILGGVGYYNAGGALDMADISRQLNWFKAQGLVKGDLPASALIDTQFLPTL